MYSNFKFIGVSLVRLLCAALLITELSTVSAQEPNPQMLLLVKNAMQLHPTVRAQQAQTLATAEDFEAAKRRRWPNLFALGSTQTGGQGSVGAEVTLYDFGKTTAIIEQAQANLEGQDFRTEEAQYSIALKVIDAWHAVQVAREKRSILNRAKIQLEQMRQTMERRVQAQVSPIIELELIAARSRQLEAEDSNQQTLIQQNLSRLKQWTGLDVLLDQQSLVEYLSHRDRLLLDYKALEQLMMPQPANQLHPSILAARQQAIASQAETRAASAKAYPEVFARIEKAMGDSLGRERNIVLGLRWESGGGMSNLALAKAQAARARALDLTAESVQLEINEQLITQRQALNNSIAKAQRLQEAAASSLQLLESYERLFTAGRKSWLEVMNALRESYEMRLAQSESSNEASNLVWQIKAKNNGIHKGEWVAR